MAGSLTRNTTGNGDSLGFCRDFSIVHVFMFSVIFKLNLQAAVTLISAIRIYPWPMKIVNPILFTTSLWTDYQLCLPSAVYSSDLPCPLSYPSMIILFYTIDLYWRSKRSIWDLTPLLIVFPSCFPAKAFGQGAAWPGGISFQPEGERILWHCIHGWNVSAMAESTGKHKKPACPPSRQKGQHIGLCTIYVPSPGLVGHGANVRLR